LQGVPGSRVRSFKLLFRTENFIHSACPPRAALHAALRPKRQTSPPAAMHSQLPCSCSHSLSPVRSEITPSSVAYSAPALSRLYSVSLPPIMTALSRSTATAVSALPAAARGPRLSVACRNPVSAAPLWGSCRMHVLLHVAVAAIMASAAFSVAHAQGWSTAQLSQAPPRCKLSAISVGTVAMFAGGACQDSKLLRIVFVCFVREC
jgi:hypothetical protein